MTRLALAVCVLIALGPGLGTSVGSATHAAATPSTLAAQQPPRVLVIATGGTIAGQASGGQLTGAQIVGAVPGLDEVATIEVEEFSRVGSSAVTPDHWLRLARRINEVFSDDPALRGIIVTHGTDTMEETAYFLHLTVDDERPVVMVGSMRNSSAVSADGPANLLSGARVAVSPEARARGVLVVLNDEVHSARDVRKMDNNRLDTFASSEWGALGIVDADRIVFRRGLETRHTSTSDLRLEPGTLELPSVPIVADFTGSDAALLRAAHARRPAAIVVQAFGGGRASPETRRAYAEIAADGVPVLLASRVPEGRVMGSREGNAAGLVYAGDLSPHKARIVLMLALQRPRSPLELQRLLDTH